MSANNYLEIHREDREFVISDLSADTCEGREIKRTKSLKSAIKWAKEYQQDFPAEYGIHFGNL